jgi:hypothetical protein
MNEGLRRVKFVEIAFDRESKARWEMMCVGRFGTRVTVAVGETGKTEAMEIKRKHYFHS